MMDLDRQSLANAGEAFDRDGFVVVKQHYSRPTMLDWKQRIVQLLEEQGGADGNNSGVHVWLADGLDAFFEEQMRDSSIVAMLQQIIGPDIEFLSAKTVFKNTSTTFGSPWHQDWHYWRGTNKVSIWIALDDATPENGCLKMIPASHRKLFKLQQEQQHETGFTWRTGSEEVADLPEVTLAADRGDIIFFHDQTLHSSFPNTSGADRWSLISTYRDASVHDDSTVWQQPMLVSGQSVHAQS
jgi:phytanoyl-CoA hydroxylase